MSTSPSVTRNAANDTVAQRLAQQTLEGKLDETRARWEMASLLINSDLIEQVARQQTAKQWVHPHRQASEDAATIIQAILVTKIAGHNPALDLKVIASGNSFSGWARRFAQSFEMGSTLHRTSTHLSIPVEQDVVERGASPVSPTLVADEDYQDRRVADDLVDGFTAAAHNVMKADLPVLQATALSTYYEVPLPIRGVRLANYLKLRRRLESGGQGAVPADIGDTLEDPTGGPVGLAVLWGPTVDVALLTRLRALPDIVLQAFATHSLTPLTPPPNKDIQQLVAAATSAVGCNPASRTVRKLVLTWIDTYAELTTRHRDWRVGTPPRLITAVERKANHRRWTALATDLIARGRCTGLGGPPDAVAGWLDRELAGIRINQAAR